MSGHVGIRKTMDRVLTEFFWPGVCGDVSRFCKSCDICQRTIQKGQVTKVPLGKLPLIDTPFKRIAVDIVGPIEPLSERNSRYILTMIDYATRYPEAVALPGIETERVAEALVEMFSRVGIPDEMLTDCGSQFTAEVMKEVSRLLSLQQITSTPYHPICSGLIERFHMRGWSGGAMVLGNLPVPGRPTILIKVGQGPIALAVGAGGGGLDIFTLIYPFSSFSLSLGDGPI